MFSGTKLFNEVICFWAMIYSVFARLVCPGRLDQEMAFSIQPEEIEIPTSGAKQTCL